MTNPNLLLKHFSGNIEAPGAVSRLRQLILNLAVRGKLVDQNPDDEPASEFLLRIDAEKTQRAIKYSRTAAPSLPIAKQGMDYELPSGWQWVRMAEIAKLWNGFAFGSGDFTSDGIPVVRIGDLQNGAVVLDNAVCVSEKIANALKPEIWIPPDALLIAMSGATTGKVAFNFTGRRLLLNQRVGRIELFLVNAKFIKLFFETIIARNLSISSGTAIPNLSTEQINNTIVPLAPLAEQHRIVSKVDELMKLCERLEAAQAERENQRDRLVSASLQRLSKPADEKAFCNAARFCIRHFDRLTTHPEHIQQLKKTILDLAIRGRLVRQESTDEPAEKILLRIQDEKLNLLRKGIIKKNDFAQRSPSESEFPFRLPEGWMPANLQALCQSIADGDHLPPPKADAGIPFLVIGNVRNEKIDFSGCRHVLEEYYNNLNPIRRPRKGDVLYTLVGSYGIPVLVEDNQQFCVQRHIGILRPSNEINSTFLYWILGSRWVFDQASKRATGIAQKTVPLEGLRNILIPLPPIAEQNRIVTRVNELITLCHQIELQLSISQSEKSRLFDSLLHNALLPYVNLNNLKNERAV